jgi:hypothetical protein
MKIFKAYFEGLKSTLKTLRMSAIIYSVIFLFAVIIAMPFHSALSNQAGNTMALHGLLKHFSYTSFSDFMHSASKSLSPLLLEAVWMGGLYFLFVVFFTGGILSVLKYDGKKFSFVNFLSGCGEYFFRFLRLGIYLLIVELIIALAVFIPLTMLLSNNYETTQNEASLFYISVSAAFVFAVLFILVLIVGDYAKIILFKEDSSKVIRAIGRSVKFVFRHLIGTYALYLIILTGLILSFVVYFILDNEIGMVSGFTIVVMFIIQQVIIWLRILIKIWFLGSELSYYKFISRSENNLLAEEVIPDNFSSSKSEDMIQGPEPA